MATMLRPHRIAVAVLMFSSFVLSATGVPARAAPASPAPSVDSGVHGPDNPVTLVPFYSPDVSGPPAVGGGIAPHASSARRPPNSPDSDGGQAQQCLVAPGAVTEKGRVHNRFLWCQRGRIGAQVRNRSGKVIGSGSFVFDAAAYGRDDGNRSVKVFLRAEPGTVMYDGESGEVGLSSFSVFADCVSFLGGCGAGGATATELFVDWDVDGSWHSWTIESSSADGEGPDRISRHDWAFKLFAASTEAPDTGVVSLPSHRIRCDSASVGFPSSRSQACVFDDVVPHLQYSLLSPNYPEVSAHVQCALDPSCPTYPMTGPKTIPGKYTGSSADPGLHRITETYPVDSVTGRTYYSKNTSAKDKACGALPLSDYDPSFQQCDEFPFASTIEGAGAGDGNFSVRGVTSRDNSCAGNALRNYYRNDRILVWRPGLPQSELDTYYVEITGVPAGNPDECLPPDDGPGEPNLPPTANAGPDTSGYEGLSITLAGSASDPEGAPEVSWTYSLGPDTDPGMSCAFTDAQSANTTISCTDDGTVTVTLTAFDGVNPTVSDSAVVHVANLSPQLHNVIGPNVIGPSVAGPGVAARGAAGDEEFGIAAPQPWQVFRVGDQVSFTGRFDDPGTNDSHSCKVDWDDGQATTFTTYGRYCEGTHVFARPGMYTIKPQILDDDGGASDAASVMVIVYDPAAGFATNGGFINSPAGALTADPAAEGKLTLQFNPKYLPKDAGPSASGGKVSATLHGAAFSLDSTTLDWLVVSPDDRVAVKGTGTVNGQPGYGFVAYGFTDPGAVRLVVWPLDSGPYPGRTLTYDNRAGADYDLDISDPQPLDGGSLTIHH